MPADVAARSAVRLHSRTVALDGSVRLLEHLPSPDVAVWLQGADGFVGWGEAARIAVPPGPGRFAAAASGLKAVFEVASIDDPLQRLGTGPIAFGSFTFDPDANGSTLVVPAVVLGARDGRAWLTATGPVDSAQLDAMLAVTRPPRPHSRVRYGGSTQPELAWLEAVDATIRAIRDGEADKVVLARDRLVWAEEPFDARVLVRRLVDHFPTCFTFACDRLVGSSPELLARRTGSTVESLVLAGSARRGDDETSDAALGRALLTSEKERAEHAFAVASVTGVLGDLCTRLHVDDKPRLLGLENVQHLATQVRGEIGSGLTAFDLAGLLHPTAAVCGTPTETALAMIRNLEGMDRGRYAGPVGWVDARGDGEWAIALRCAELDGTRSRLYAGAGIVADSLPEHELEETRLKLRAMQAAFEGAT